MRGYVKMPEELQIKFWYSDDGTPNLDEDDQIKLVSIMLNKIQNIRKEVDLVDVWTGKKIGKTAIITRNKEEILEILKNIPSMKILPILKEILVCLCNYLNS